MNNPLPSTPVSPKLLGCVFAPVAWILHLLGRVLLFIARVGMLMPNALTTLARFLLSL